MNVNLGEMFEKFIIDLIKTGQYQSQSEVVREALRLLKEQVELRELRMSQLRRDLDKGISDLENGKSNVYDEGSLRDAFEETKKRGRKKLASKREKAA
jgi:antitoxin ParD1/3/4